MQEIATAVTNSINVTTTETVVEPAMEEPAAKQPFQGGAANVGPGQKSNSMGNPFAGTSWGA